MLIFSTLVSSLCLLPTRSQTDSFSYTLSGTDWAANCASGSSQSPINITDTEEVDSSDASYSPLAIEWRPLTTYSVVDQGHLYQVAGDFGTFRYRNLTYTGGVFHFHAPSEHYLNDKQYPLELHIAFVNPSGFSNGLLIFSVLFSEGDGNPALSNLLSAPPLSIDLSGLFHGSKSFRDYYSYIGSETTPNCMAGVPWFVYGNVLQASQTQLDFFNKKWKDNSEFAGGRGNNRAIQKRDNRKVVHFSDWAEKLTVGAALLMCVSS